MTFPSHSDMRDLLEGCLPDDGDHTFDVDNAIYFYAEHMEVPDVLRMCPDWAGLVEPEGWCTQFIHILQERYGW